MKKQSLIINLAYAFPRWSMGTRKSYIGGKNDKEGVKLEEQALIADNGYITLSQFPYEENLLGREF